MNDRHIYSKIHGEVGSIIGSHRRDMTYGFNTKISDDKNVNTGVYVDFGEKPTARMEFTLEENPDSDKELYDTYRLVINFSRALSSEAEEMAIVWEGAKYYQYTDIFTLPKYIQYLLKLFQIRNDENVSDFKVLEWIGNFLNFGALNKLDLNTLFDLDLIPVVYGSNYNDPAIFTYFDLNNGFHYSYSQIVNNYPRLETKDLLTNIIDRMPYVINLNIIQQNTMATVSTVNRRTFKESNTEVDLAIELNKPHEILFEFEPIKYGYLVSLVTDDNVILNRYKIYNEKLLSEDSISGHEYRTIQTLIIDATNKLYRYRGHNLSKLMYKQLVDELSKEGFNTNDITSMHTDDDGYLYQIGNVTVQLDTITNHRFNYYINVGDEDIILPLWDYDIEDIGGYISELQNKYHNRTIVVENVVIVTDTSFDNKKYYLSVQRNDEIIYNEEYDIRWFADADDFDEFISRIVDEIKGNGSDELRKYLQELGREVYEDMEGVDLDDVDERKGFPLQHIR